MTLLENILGKDEADALKQRQAKALGPKPEVTRTGMLDMQVCAPEAFTDVEVEVFAAGANPCGTTNGWHIRKQGSKYLSGCDERVKCEEREGCVHLMLDA